MSHTYVWKGRVYPSVTTALQVVAKPALVNWAARRVAEAAVSEADVIANLAAVDSVAAIERLVKAPWAEKGQAAAAGTALHDVAHTVATGGSIEFPVQPVVNSFLAFVKDCHPDFLYNEQAVYSPQHGYAGTFDSIAKLGDRLVMLDYKTGKAVYPEYTLQLAAYRYADFIGTADGLELELPDVDGAMVVHLTPDGYDLVEVDAGMEAFEAFLSALTLWLWLQTHSK